MRVIKNRKGVKRFIIFNIVTYIVFSLIFVFVIYRTVENYYRESTILNISYLIPPIIAILGAFLVFMIVVNIVGHRFIFAPLLEDAHIDTLTGLHNRRHMEKNLHLLVSQLSRSSGFLSVLMVDIDFFKAYNDTYGHDAGDKCLKAIADVLKESVNRAGDMVIRYGGEEFLVVLPSTDENGARIISEKLINNVRELKIPHKSSETFEYVTISIGATSGKVSHTDTWESYVLRADVALYKSKNNNRNTYTFLTMEQS